MDEPPVRGSDLQRPRRGRPIGNGPYWIVAIFLLGFLGVFFVLLPGVLVLFYGRKDVKKTCEARDPLVRWTDACPLPVLALSVFVGLGAAMMLPTLLSYNGVAPWFGILVDGALPASSCF